MNFDEYFQDHQYKDSEKFKTGEYLHRNGAPVKGVYYIHKGSVQIISQTDTGFLSREIKTSGDIIALEEIRLKYHVSDAIAMEETTVIFFSSHHIGEDPTSFF